MSLPCLLLLCWVLSPARVHTQTLNDNLWVTDGTVYTVATRGDVVYIGGAFSFVGPATGSGVPIGTGTGAPDAGFPQVNGAVYDVVPDGVGGWFIGGSFTTVGGVPRNMVAHINPDKSVDLAWNPVILGDHVKALAISGSTLYLGGYFSNIAGQTRNSIAALNAITGVPKAWNPNMGGGVVNVIVPSGSRVYVGGLFDSVDTQPRRNIAVLDTLIGRPLAWTPNANSGVYSILPAGSTVYAGGLFTQIGGQTRNYLAALDATSGLATTWNPGANFAVMTLGLAGSNLYVGGWFTSMGGQPRNHAASFNMATGLVTSWNPGPNSDVNALFVSGPTVFMGGDFDTLGGQSRNRIAAVDTLAGSVSPWDPSINGSVLCLAGSGQAVYAGGSFSSVGAQVRRSAAAIDVSTGRATSWNPVVGPAIEGQGVVWTIVPTDSSVYIGGDFRSIGGQPRRFAAAVDIATAQVMGWNPDVNSTVQSIVIAGSTVYLGGSFSTVGGQARSGIASVNATTGVVTTWNPNQNATTSHTIQAMALSGVTMYVGGFFSDIGGVARSNVAAIDALTGQLQPWNPGSDGAVTAIALAESTLYLGGYFHLVGGNTRNYLAEVNLRTAQPPPWNPNPDGTITSLAIGGSNVYAGGFFDTLGGQRRVGIAAIARAPGLPTGWNPALNGSVYGLTIAGTTVYVGGLFDEVLNRVHPRFAAITDPSLPVPQFSVSSRSMSFGNVFVGQTKRDSVLVSNIGYAPLVVASAISSNPQYSVLPPAATIAPGASRTFYVSFAPASPGLSNARILLTHNGSTLPDSITVTGTGTIPVPQFAVSSRSLSFGSVPVGQIKPDSLLVTNTGDLPLNIASAVSTNPAYIVLPPTATIAAGTNRKFYVSFAPTAMGLSIGRVVFTHNGSTSPDSVTTSGTGTTPGFSVSPGSLSFGNVVVGSRRADSVTVTNTGNVPLYASTESSDSQFTITPASDSLQPSASRKFFISFSPASTGLKTARILFTHNGPSSPDSIAVSGVGSPPSIVVPTSLSFGVVPLGQVKRDSVAVTNLSTSSLVVASVLADSPYSVIPASVSIFPLSSQTFSVTFRPTSEGYFPGSIRFLGATGGLLLTVPVSGTCVRQYVTVNARPVAGRDADVSIAISPSIVQRVQSGILFFRKGGERAFDSLTTARSGDSLRLTLPARSVTNRGIEYFIRLNFGNGEFADLGLQMLRVLVPGQASALTLQGRVYKMISVPVELTNPQIPGFLQASYGPYNTDRWRLFRWEGNAYAEYLQIHRYFEPGNAFWLITDGGNNFAVDSGFSVMSLQPFRVQLDTGWNQIGNPFAFPVAWDSIAKPRGVSFPSYYDGAQYVPNVGVLRPWEGYFVNNGTGAQVTLAVPASGANEPPGKQHSIVTVPPDCKYQLQLSAVTADARYRDTYNYVGFVQDASRTDDTYNCEEPPPVGDGIQLSILRDQKRYMTDFKEMPQDGASWRVQLRSALPNQQVQLAVEETGEVPGGFGMYVLDMDNANMILSGAGSFSLHVNGRNAPRTLLVIVGTRQYAEAQSNGIPLEPLEFALRQNYPNPFNPQTLIGYQLSKRSRVQLMIYDILGQRVRSLVSEEQITGRYSVVWDGRTDAGQNAASGMYFYQLRAGDFVASRKLLLVR